MYLPEDDFILLSLINTALRDKYASLEELCSAEDVDRAYLTARLAKAGYEYRPESNSFK